MVILRNGQIVEMCCSPLKTELFGQYLLIRYVNIFAFSCLSCRKSLCDVFCQCKKCLLTNYTNYKFEHSSISLCISDTSNAKEISTGYEEVRKRNDIGTLHTLLSVIFFGTNSPKSTLGGSFCSSPETAQRSISG